MIDEATFKSFAEIEFEPATAPEAWLLSLMRGATILCDDRPGGDCSDDQNYHRCRECGDGLMIRYRENP